MPDLSARSIRRSLAVQLLRFGFRQLYTNFAWSYDAVAATVSLGEWKEWGRAALPFIMDPRAQKPDSSKRGFVTPKSGFLVLEIAHGPGHLHLELRRQGCRAVGIDLSPQMSQMAAGRLRRAGLSNSVARADVMRLPFPDEAFGAVVSTFPAEFIFAAQTLDEVARVLVCGGRFVVVPTATPRAGDALAQIAGAWQRSARPGERDLARIKALFEQAGFGFEPHVVPTRHAEVFVWVCIKKNLPTVSQSPCDPTPSG
jgi:ubiquinone/menaquinone biosynthesis C-methylase UbiE